MEKTPDPRTQGRPGREISGSVSPSYPGLISPVLRDPRSPPAD